MSAATSPGIEPVGAPEDYSGVYAAKPQQLLIGPLVHLEHYLTGETGSVFGNTGSLLPPPSLRYVVDCCPHTGDLPQMPHYAMLSTPLRDTALRSTSPSQLPPTSAVAASGDGSAAVPASRNTFMDPMKSSGGMTTPLSSQEAVRRMNSNAADFLAKLRQRCVANGISTSTVAAIREASAAVPQSPLESSSSSSSSLMSIPALDATSTPQHGDTAAVAAEVAAIATPSSPLPPPAPASANAMARLPTIKAQVLAQASRNEQMARRAAAVLGADHVLRCLIPNTEDSLDSAPVQEVVSRLSSVLRACPEAQVYVYSLDGKGTASALATLYLIQVERVPLHDVLTRRLPACTPRMPCLVQLVAKDPSPATFDKLGYLRQYLARRYPAASAASIEAAVSTCNGHYVKAERLVRTDMAFRTTNGVLHPSHERHRASSTAASGVGTGREASMPSQVRSSRSSDRMASGGLGMRQMSNGSSSDFSLCSSLVAVDPLPLQLTTGDEKVIDSLYRALADGHVGVSRDEVAESYVAHRRSQDAVLRQFLLRYQAPAATGTRLYGAASGAGAWRSGSGGFGGSSTNEEVNSFTPTIDVLRAPISLAQFASQPASRRGSARAAAAAMKTPKAQDVSLSPEPSRPPISPGITPHDTVLASTPKKREKGAAARRLSGSPMR